MKSKKILALALSAVMVLAFFAGCNNNKPNTDETNTGKTDTNSDTVAKLDWAEYDNLITKIKSATDFVEREKLMHEAEDILMKTGAICPLYFYNDIYMMKPAVQGFYSNVYGTKFFMYATNGDSKTLKLNLASEPNKLDPALNSSVDGACLAANSFAGLFTYNEKGEVIPALCESYTVSEDGLTYVFTLKDGLKWSDGSALNAKDFEYSWKRAANPETAADYSYMLSGIKGYGTDAGVDVKASEDGKTFTVNLIAPCAYMLDLCAFPTFLPVKQSVVEAAAGYKGSDGKIVNAGAWATEAGFVSNGAYVLESWKHNESMIYVKNPNYYDAANVKIERLEFMLSADDTAIYAAYESGNLDFIDTVPNDKIPVLKSSSEFYKIDQLGTYYISFNVKSNLFKGKTAQQASDMRNAFGLLINRAYIVETCGQTGQEIANTFVPAGMLDGHGGVFKTNDKDYTFPNKDDVGYFLKGDTEEDLNTNKEAAIKLLEGAGYKFKDGKLDASTPITFEYLVNETSGHQAIAQCVQQDLAKIGITMTIKTIDWDTFLAERKAGNYDVARNGWIADFNDPINFLEMWATDSGNNDCQFGR